MNVVEIITKKRDGLELSQGEIEFFVKGIVENKIPDYQITPLLMAIYINGMTQEETFYLTKAMIDSGEVLDLSSIEGFKIDKHSTGGVGDKLTLASCPIAAAAGIKIAKMSGRGLGFTGGTIDKLMAIPGFHVDISMEKFYDNVRENGIALMAQSDKIAVADKIIYSLRDVSGTVESMPLIVSSIMSKKLALGADGIILDVKYGSGALMKTYDDAEKMAKEMKKIGESFGKKVEYILSPMTEPLGSQVGNANEIKEVLDFLKGNGPEDLHREAINLAAKMIHMAGYTKSMGGACDMAESIVKTGRGLEMFKDWIVSQGGDPKVINNYGVLPGYEFCEDITGEMLGVGTGRQIDLVDAHIVGQAAGLAGAGRMTKDDVLDLGAGVKVNCKSGASVAPETVVFQIFGNNRDKVQAGKERLLKACIWK